MAVCGLRTLLLIVCVLELIVTVQRQVFDFMGYMWLPIIINFLNILLIIFGSFGAVQYITKYLIAYAVWSFMWFTWNIFLICYYLNLGTLNRESGLLSLGTGSVSWWEGNGWGCQPVWGEIDGPGTWRPTRVDGCFLQWDHVELAQSTVATVLILIALPLTVMLAQRSLRHKVSADKGTLPRRPVYTIELNTTETNVNETSLKPMTPRRVKRRSGSRGAGSSVRRSRRSYRNVGYLASNGSLTRENRPSRPTSAHSSYSNFHGTRPTSYHNAEPEVACTCLTNTYDSSPVAETVPIVTNSYNTVRRGNPGRTKRHDVIGPYGDTAANISSYENNRGYETSSYDGTLDMISPCESVSYGSNSYAGGYVGDESGWEAPPPPAPPYSARATPQAPGPPAYQSNNDFYNMVP